MIEILGLLVAVNRRCSSTLVATQRSICERRSGAQRSELFVSEELEQIEGSIL